MLDQNGFSIWADTYDKNISNSMTAFPFIGYDKTLRELKKMITPSKGLKVLDVGVGTGLLAEELFRCGCSIFGIDFSQKMINHAQSRVPQGHFILEDISTHGLGQFANSRFDRIVSSYFFHHLNYNQQINFIKTTLRDNLSKNGKIIIADIAFQTHIMWEQGKQHFFDSWDEREYYMCGDNILKKLSEENIDATYKQISVCSGIICINHH